QLLAAVYRLAAEAGRSVSAPHARPGGRSRNPETAFVEAAFRSLPERWRGAVWLSDVEAMDPERVARVLGVSVAVAHQLINRGRRGLEGRFAQAHQPVPEHLGTALRAFTMAIPANLADVAATRWA